MIPFRAAAVIALAVASAWVPVSTGAAQPPGFDHTYEAYARVLARHVQAGRVDYRGLAAERTALAGVSAGFSAVDAGAERGWPRAERLAFWINAYNLFTLQAIVDHYPIRAGWLSRGPRNSIRQIDGVWDRLTWKAAGRTVTLDDIEHRIIRPGFEEPRIHFAVNCASVGCPPLLGEPYRAADLERQLDANARAYLASPQGVRTDGRTLAVTSILKWYGDDFVARFGSKPPLGRSPRDAAILRVVEAFGPPEASTLARDPAVRIAFLDYDWSLNDVVRPR